ncbi:hypothetical protein [Desemzia sp. FAM 23991]|uniref:hypothetical protein n=1 Tax=unclassified Desemzia TaxID=2685243 RepID=UPI0038848030
MVTVRNAVESTYIGKCTIWKKEKIKLPNGSTSFGPVIDKPDIPCKLSFSNINSANSSDNATLVSTVVKLFINPDIKIEPGSKLVVTQNGETNEYGKSGEPALYFTHQEIILESFGGWT